MGDESVTIRTTITGTTAGRRSAPAPLTADGPSISASPDEAVTVLGTGPVPAAPYHDAEHYELERRAIFLRTWIVVGHVSELPVAGSYVRRRLEFADASLLITRGRDDVVRAFHNVCTHRGTELVTDDAGTATTFTCPYHFWSFGGDGALRSAPDFDRFGLDKADCGLKAVAVDICGGLIFVHLGEPSESLRDYLGELAEPLDRLPAAEATTFAEYTYEIDANWKLVYDNFQENYHLRYVHSRTGAAALGPDNPYGYPTRFGFHGPHRTQTIWSNPSPTLQPFQLTAMTAAFMSAMERGIVGRDTDRDYFALFPNFFVLGTPMQHFSHVVYPLSATRSRGVIRMYWVGDDDRASTRFAREYVLATVRDIHAEDIDAIERCQRGLSTGALSHVHFQTMEGLCRHLYETAAAWVDQYRSSLDEGAPS